MKIALFTIHNAFACSYAIGGYRETLKRMGHEVLDCPFPGNAVQNVAQVAATMPKIEELMECDVILATYMEYVQPWLSKLYSMREWEALMAKVPVLARYDESMDRGDLGLPQRMPELLRWAKFHSFPAAQDAAKYGGEWLPYGADTSIFHPNNSGQLTTMMLDKSSQWPDVKKYDVAFIGTLYGKRQEYLAKLVNHLGHGTVFYQGNVFVQDLSGIRERESTELLAENYRAIKIFFCLPPLSRLIVEKVVEVMACETLVLFPRLTDDAEANLSIFEHNKHIVYYDLGFFADNGKQVRHLLAHPEEIHAIAAAGSQLVSEKYTLRIMLEKMLAQVMRRDDNSRNTLAAGQ